MCLGCGFDGRELQGERGRFTFVCPCCGEDLYARPPRSYAQLEGLVSRRLIEVKAYDPPARRSRPILWINRTLVRVMRRLGVR